jgi:peptidoglycan/LPS O-acetylase OafA/YrhL
LKHDNNFDLLRLFAACQVVYMHGAFQLHLPRGGPLFDLASAFPGVACFFIISGFLVSDSYLRSTTLDYFLKRALRIYPALIVNIAVLEAAMYFTGGFKQPVDWSLYPLHFIALASTASDFFSALVTHAPIYASGFFKSYPSGVLWTLTVELSFYLLLPLPLEVYKRNTLAGTAGLIIMMVASFMLSTNFSEAFQVQHPGLNITVPAYFWVFGIGIAARLMWPRIKPIVQGKAAFWLPVYLAVSFIACSALEPPAGGPIWLEYKTQPTIIVAVRSCLLALTLLSCAYTLPATSRLLRGYDLSYAIYLYHMLIVSILIGLNITGSAYLWPAIYLTTAMIAWVSWRYIESPSLQAKHSLRSETAVVLAAAETR